MKRLKLKKEIKRINFADRENDIRIDLLKELINLKPHGNHYDKVITIKNWLMEDENAILILNVLDQYEKWVLGWLLPNLTIEFRVVIESCSYRPNFDWFCMPEVREVMKFIKQKVEPPISLLVYRHDCEREVDILTSHELIDKEISIEDLGEF